MRANDFQVKADLKGCFVDSSIGLADICARDRYFPAFEFSGRFATDHMLEDSTTNRSVRNGRFYLSIAVASTLVVFAGFARSYYLRSVFGFPRLPGFLH